MRLTKEQFDALTPYRTTFETMARSQWARHPGSSALDLMHDIRAQVTGTKERPNKSCSTCIMRLIKQLGAIYLADLEEKTKVAMAEREEAERRVVIKGEDIAAEMEAVAKRPRRRRTKRTEI